MSRRIRTGNHRLRALQRLRRGHRHTRVAAQSVARGAARAALVWCPTLPVLVLRVPLLEERGNSLAHIAGLRCEDLLPIFERDDGFEAACVDARVQTLLREPYAD